MDSGPVVSPSADLSTARHVIAVIAMCVCESVGVMCTQSVDLNEETINLEVAETTDVRQLPSKVPSDHARYHFFTFRHTHEGDQLNTIGNH